MEDESPLRPSRVVAIFPFGVSASPIDGRQADLCRGLAVLVERRLGRLPGVQPLLQNLFISPESDPGRKGWLLTNTLWSVDQALSLPIVNGENPTHLLQGLLTFTGDSVRVEMDLIDMEGGYSLVRESHEGPANGLIEHFFRVLRPVAASLMESAAAGRVVTRLPTRDNEAFELLVMGLASMQAHAQGMVGAAVPLQLLADAVERDGELIEATQELERLVRGLVLEDAELRAKAVDALMRARVAAPWNAELGGLEGLIHARHGEAEAALPLLEAYLKHEGRSEMASQVLAALARIHRSRNNLTDARRLLHAATSASPENVTAWEELAECHLATGDALQAEECWRRALQEDPDRAGPLAALGEAYRRRGDAHRALPLLERAHAMGHAPERVVPGLVDALAQLGRLPEADELATGWVEENPESVEGWLGLAKVRHRMKDPGAVARCLREARERSASERQRADVAMVDFGLRQPLEHAEFRRIVLMTTVGAREAENLAWKLSTGVFAAEDHPDIHEQVARLAERAGDATRAIAALDRLRALGWAVDAERVARLKAASMRPAEPPVVEPAEPEPAEEAEPVELPEAKPTATWWQRVLGWLRGSQ